MSGYWTPGVGVDTSIGLGVGYKETVDLSPSRANGDVYLVVGDHVAEIRLERVHVEALRDQIPGVLAVLDRTDADNAACDQANAAATRAVELATWIVDQTVAAELAGELERAGELRTAADQLRASVDAVDAAVTAVDEAALAADRIVENARDIAAGRAQPAEGGTGDDRPVELAG